MQDILKTKDLFDIMIEQERAALLFGFYWENLEQLLEQIKSECLEVKEAHQNQNRNHLKEEVGDLINATISLSIFLGFDPYKTLNESVHKFQNRYDALVKIVQKDGLQNLKNKSVQESLSYWDKAKEICKQYPSL